MAAASVYLAEFLARSIFIRHRSNASILPSVQISAALLSVSEESGADMSHLCSITASAMLKAPSALTSPGTLSELPLTSSFILVMVMVPE